MAEFIHFPLQQAVYQALTADSSLMGGIVGVFDRPPQGTDFPYVTLGESTVTDWSSKTTVGTQQLLTLHVWSREGGRKQAAGIMERLHTLLHQANLSVAGQALVLLRFVTSNITLGNDGWTYQGMMQFQALLQANE